MFFASGCVAIGVFAPQHASYDAFVGSRFEWCFFLQDFQFMPACEKAVTFCVSFRLCVIVKKTAGRKWAKHGFRKVSWLEVVLGAAGAVWVQ